MALTPEQIMGLWERDHQQLTPEHQQQFLSRPEVGQLAELPPGIVRAAIRRSARLADILAEARRQSAKSGTVRRPPADVQPATKARASAPTKAARKKPSRKKTSSRSSARNQRDREARQRNGADYVGSSTLRRAGNRERDLRERCSSCGVLFDPASSHDC